jgi:NADH-quinone oxidoreductase subunit I
MKNPFSEVYFGLKSLFIGMGITLGEFFKPTITVRYPYETLKIPARFRGHIELVRDSATGQPKCFVCKLCEKACPSDCITVEGIKPEGARRKTVTSYRLDFTKCSLCGSCVEACRDGAIRFSREYNLAGTRKEDFIMDLFQRLEAQRLQDEKSGGRVGPVTNVSFPPSGLPKPAEPGVEGPPQPTAALPKASQTPVEAK